jgi:hypothetical protein
MTAAFLRLLIPLFFAHLLGDFVFQTDASVRNKARLPVLIRHGVLIGALSYLFLGLVQCWQIPLGILISHSLLDAWKKRTDQGTALSRFLLDQAGHLVILALFAWAGTYAYGEQLQLGRLLFGQTYFVLLTFLCGAITSIYVGSFLVELSLEALGIKGLSNGELGLDPAGKLPLEKGLAQGGRVIGYLERGLILLFMLADYPAGIGFLVAAKSIFRFGELTDSTRRSQAEYIIIGTLLSILIGTAVSYLTVSLINWLLA